MKRHLIVLALALAIGSIAVAPAHAIIIGPFSGVWDGSEDIQTGRIFRDGIPSDGTGSKAWPGVFDNNPQGFDVFTFFNHGPQGVVTIDVTVSSTDTHVSAYLGQIYFPLYSSNGPNYLGDLGESVSQAFSILVPGSSYFMVVANTNFGLSNALGDSYSFTVEGDDIAAVPEPGTITLLGLGLGALAVRRNRRNRPNGSPSKS